jgi:prolyl-tRNA synthetase
MRWTETLIPTLREEPKDAEAVSHKLMLRAGYIRKLSSGVYSYLPLGTRVLGKIAAIIEEEMFRQGADILLLPALHPAELWKKTGRYDSLGQDKIAFKNRTDQEFVLGPTHEEVITELVGAYVRSYKDLPKILFQIQTKFRDELRPRFGVVRTKEFIMKDAYSFDRDEQGLDESYRKMHEAYQRIFTRSGLEFSVVTADPGMMGGKMSQEFMVKSDFGEDMIIQCPKCQNTASRDIAARGRQEGPGPLGNGVMEAFDTPDLRTIEEIAHRFQVEPQRIVKTLLYMGDGKPVACLVRGDREVNEAKARRLAEVETLTPATREEIERITGAPIGFSGPVGLSGVKVLADYDLLHMADFVTGANQKDRHLRGVNMGRDFRPDLIGDLRYAEDGDPCAQCGGPLTKGTALEVGHIFKLGTRYTQAFDVNYLDEKGVHQTVIMGCYGIGLNRIIAAHIDQHHDAKGIVWSKALAPYQVVILCLNQSDKHSVETSENLYATLTQEGLEVLYDNRDERAGVKFNDADLIGIPIQLVVGERNLREGKVEIVRRAGKRIERAPLADALRKLQDVLGQIP